MELEVKGLKGEYFDNMECSGTPVLTRIDQQIDFSWAEESPTPGVPKDKFSVRWTGVLQPTASGAYELSLQTDDGSRLYLDEKLLIDHWRDMQQRPSLRPSISKAGRHIRFGSSTMRMQAGLLRALDGNGIRSPHPGGSRGGTRFGSRDRVCRPERQP